MPVVTRQARQLCVVFLLYVLVVFTFGGVYWILYLRVPSSFSFQADILRAQSTEFSMGAEKLLRARRQRADALRALLRALEGGAQPVDMRQAYSALRVVITTTQYRYSYELAVSVTADSWAIYLETSDPAGNRIDSMRVPGGLINHLPTTVEEWRMVTTTLVSDVDGEIRETERRLTTLSSPAPEVWSFWDFLYFSAITQSTVGYGDILPNRTVIRTLVILQLLISAVLVILVLNIVLLGDHGAPGDPEQPQA